MIETARRSDVSGGAAARMRRPRPARAVLAAAVAAATLLAVGVAGPAGAAATARPGDAATAAKVMRIVRTAMARKHLRAVIVKVSVGGRVILTRAAGISMTGVPATTGMHFRNGAVAISYVANLLLQLVDEKKVRLTDKLSKWLPEIPNSSRVTLGQLAQMTSGYHDYVEAPGFFPALDADPFRTFTPRQLLSYAVSEQLIYRPGTNWSYAHTNYVILGLALEKITGQKMTRLMRDRVLRPLGLTHTTDPQSPRIPEPVLHAFTSQRRESLGIPRGRRFYEESTYWNPSWTITHGAIQTTNIDDLHATAIAIGTGKLLSRASYRAMVSTDQRRFGGPVPGCATCRRGDRNYAYGLGVVIKGSWLMQNPFFGGYAAAEAYLPSRRIAIAVAATLGEKAFKPDGDAANPADSLFAEIGAALAPGDPPPGAN